MTIFLTILWSNIDKMNGILAIFTVEYLEEHPWLGLTLVSMVLLFMIGGLLFLWAVEHKSIYVVFALCFGAVCGYGPIYYIKKILKRQGK